MVTKKQTRIVISQPMFFPWVGIFEQMRICDTFIHYDDVQMPQGRSFINRVEIKTKDGVRWMTIPVLTKGRGLQLIKDVQIDNSQSWKQKHLETLKTNYRKAPFYNEMEKIVEMIYSLKTDKVSDLNIFALENIAAYFDISCRFLRSSKFKIKTRSSQKLLELMLCSRGTNYITGHGAKSYLDHQLFEKHNISVEYMDYQKITYPQLYGKFTPYVSILDLIANVGVEGKKYLVSKTVSWKKFIRNQK